MPAKRKSSKRRTKKTVETAAVLQAREDDGCGVSDMVEDDGNKLDMKQLDDSSSGNQPTTSCIDLEKPQTSESPPDTESGLNEFSVASSAEAVEDISEANNAEAVGVDCEVDTNCQPQLDASGPSEQRTTTEALPSAENVQPNPPEVLGKRRKQTFGRRKRSQKQNTKPDGVSTEGTWEVSSRDDNSMKNVVRIRRHHPTGIPDTRRELAASPVRETALSQSQVLCETVCDTEQRPLSVETGEDDLLQEQVVSITQEPIDDTENTQSTDTVCAKAETLDDATTRTVDSFASADGTNITRSEGTVVRPKRRRKMVVNTEACRKSQRRSSRRQDANESVDSMPTSTSTTEAKTSDSCKHADVKIVPSLVPSRPEVLQEQVACAGVIKTEPAPSVSSSVMSQTEATTGSSDAAVLNYNVVSASVRDIAKPMTPVLSAERSDAVAETSVKSPTTGFVDRRAIVDISEDQLVSKSASDVSPTLESESLSCSYLAADLNVSSRPSSDTSVMNTCLSATFFDTISPHEQSSYSSAARPLDASGTGSKVENAKAAETSSSVDVALVNSRVSFESESEEVCKMILAEVVENVAREACLMSEAKENVQSVDSGSVESSGHESTSATTLNESDSTSGEIPLKKRRGRHVFASCQPSSTVSASLQSGSDRRAGGSAWPSSRRRKVSSSSSRRHLPPGNKYVGAHTSVIGNVACAVHAAAELGSHAFGMFVKRQNQLHCEPLTSEEVSAFRKALLKYGYSPHMVLPHGSYLLNCGSSDPKILRESQESLVDDLQRCRVLGLPHFNFHPGSFGSQSGVDECIERIAESINYAHSRVEKVVTVLENMPGQTGTIGGSFLELRRIINRIKDKSRIGICLDTCHAFAAGYDIRTESGYDEMMHDLEQFIGLKYLKAVHINDSRDDVGSHVDHHASIGRGRIGLDCFRRIMNDQRFENLPLILETPVDSHPADIDLLYSFVV